MSEMSREQLSVLNEMNLWGFEKYRSEVHIKDALKLSDLVGNAIEMGLPIPAWALAVRSLAGAYRRLTEQSS